MKRTRTAAVPVAPGEILQEELQARGWTQSDLAQILGRPAQVISEIVTGRKSVTAETAVALGKALGTSAEFWLNLQTAYSLHQAMAGTGSEAVAQRARIYRVVPVSALVRRGWLPKTKDARELERAVLKFLGVASLDQSPSVVASFRRSGRAIGDSPGLVAWIRRAETLAEKEEAGCFEPRKLRAAAPELPRLSAMENWQDRVADKLADLGIRYVTVEHVPRTYVDGATLWLSGGSPVVALSLRYVRIDYFWFTLMHELAHVLMSSQTKRSYLDTSWSKPAPGASSEAQSQEEAAANRMAQDWIIPTDSFRRLRRIKSSGGGFSGAVIRRFASGLGIHPGLVVGRLQFERLLPYTHFRGLLGGVSKKFSS